MKKKLTQKNTEPSKASQREIPELDLSKVKVLGRGRHVEKAQRSFHTLDTDRKVLDDSCGSDTKMDSSG